MESSDYVSMGETADVAESRASERAKSLFSGYSAVHFMPIFCQGKAMIVWYFLYIAVFVHWFCLAAGVYSAPEYMRFGNSRTVRLSTVWIWPLLPLAVLWADVLVRRELRGEPYRALAQHGCHDGAKVERTRREFIRTHLAVGLAWLTSLVVAGACCFWLRNDDRYPYLLPCLVIPCSVLFLPSLTIAWSFLGLITMLSLRNIEELIAAVGFESGSASPEAVEGSGPEGVHPPVCRVSTRSRVFVPSEAGSFWIQRLKEHQCLDRRLEKIWKSASIPLLIGGVSGAALSFLCVIEGFHIFEQRHYYEAAMRFCVPFTYSVIMIVMMWRPAQITEKCMSMRAVDRSLRLVAADCGVWEMTPEARICYNTFMAHVDRALMGAEVAGLGRVDTSLLVTKLSAVAAAAPVALSFFIKKVEDNTHIS